MMTEIWTAGNCFDGIQTTAFDTVLRNSQQHRSQRSADTNVLKATLYAAGIEHPACRRNPTFLSGSLGTLQGLRSESRREEKNVQSRDMKYSEEENGDTKNVH
jgi:hypothetical protein